MARAMFPGISDEIAQSIHQQSLLTRTEAKKMTKLDQEMADILARTDLSPYQKITLFQTTLNKFRTVRDDIVENGTMLLNNSTAMQNFNDSQNLSSALKEALSDILQDRNESDSARQKATRKRKASDDSATETPRKMPHKLERPVDVLIDEKVEDPIVATPVFSKNPSNGKEKKMKQMKRSSNLNNDLLSHKDFATETAKGVIKYKSSSSIPNHLWNETINALTSSNAKLDKPLSSPVKKLAADIVDHMVTENINLADYTEYPLIKSLLQAHQRRTRNKNHRRTYLQSGGYMVDFKKWE
jgi:hypothetical protein